MKKNAIFIGLMAALCTIGCNSHKEEKKEERTFKVTQPIAMDTTIVKEYVCQIHSIRHIELRAMEKGYLQNITVDEGQKVNKGQHMFGIMPTIYEAELQKAKAEGNAAQIEYKNTKLLADSNVVSPNELALSKARFNKANAEISLAATHLGFTDIRAPFSGVIDHLHVREGSMLDEGELLTTLSDNSKMWVYFNVPEAEYLNYIVTVDKTKKQKVNLLMANNLKFNQPGIVETIEGEFNNETGNIAFRATFNNPDSILRHGETGTILMTIPLKNVLIIPQKTTFEVLNKRYVFVIDKNNIVQQREITIGQTLENLFVITKGLDVNDKILLDGIRLVKDKDKIKYNLENPQKVLASLDVYAE
ncbi:membrane fusion protein (multidrug efflux system) [Flavobacterium sp. 7E]|uniref:efflux RND transporter periplasmic adaptor subunit n=1 Tax=unclassified Flavobacterium TaxID=196869 RepID=UPI001570FF1B|nr:MULTISPECIES: efflux RND transporter periplasmic adaptor subunit [unclassified Flavobacterium]MBE0392132.1 Efflux pump periplasmic linker BepD [Flavobacterium sp. PL002]NRS87958.1 membrane fusion protein (multidrug efflux system) [Flavobacterium sp. 7E]